MDVHKDTITYAVALPGRAGAGYRGEIAHTPKAVNKLMERLSVEFNSELLLFCYETGPIGYHLYRQLMASGHECQVVAPSQIPHKPGGERIKTHRSQTARLSSSICGGHAARLVPVRTGCGQPDARAVNLSGPFLHS